MLQDLKYAMRGLMRTKGVSAVAILSLALGIAGNTIVFSVVNAFVLVPVPYRDPDRLVFLLESRKQMRDDLEMVAPGTFFDWQARSRAFESLAAVAMRSATLSAGAEPEPVDAASVTGDMIALLGRLPERGRGFLPDEDRPGASRVAIVSHDLWERRFASDPSIVGRTVKIDGEPHEIVGVMPRDFESPNAATDVWTPARLDHLRAPRDQRSMVVIGRLRPGPTFEQAQSEMQALAVQLGTEHPESAGYSPMMLRAKDDFPGPRDRRLLLSLMGAAIAVLIIACVNVANLLLARAQTRSREIAVRVALGAARGRLVRQLLTESVLLSTCGGLLGVLLAWWGLDTAVAALPRELPRLYEMRLNTTVLAFTALVSLLGGLLFGLAPALQASRMRQDALKSGGRSGSPTRGARRLRSVLVAGEVAVALIALTATGLLIRSTVHLQTVDPGFPADRLLTLRVALPAKYATPSQIRGFYDPLLERVRAIPGVERAAAVNALPRGRSTPVAPIAIDGQTVADPRDQPQASWLSVSPDYFATLGVPVMRGRAFAPADRENRTPVAIVNRAMADRFWPGRDPIGQRVRLLDEWREIVAVCGNVMQDRIQFDASPRALIYIPAAQLPTAAMSLVIRVAADPVAVASSVRSIVREIDADQPVADVLSMRRYIEQQFAGVRVLATIFSLFDLLALLLAGIGIYGLMAQSVSERTQEIGIRMALGARPATVLRATIREAALLAGAGALVGFVGAALVSRGLTSVLFGVDPMDPLTFGSVAALLALVAACASYVPARRATSVDPMVALRQE